MDLQTAKLVAFAIYTEADTGIMGVAPDAIDDLWASLSHCTTDAEVLGRLPDDMRWKWDNYWSIWSDEAQEAAPEPEDDKVEITEKGLNALDEHLGPEISQEIAAELAPPPAEVPEEKPAKKKGKRGK